MCNQQNKPFCKGTYGFVMCAGDLIYLSNDITILKDQIKFSIKNSNHFSAKRITFARNLSLRNGFKMWYSWSSECWKINII